MELPYIIDHIADKNTLTLRVVDENADVFHIVVSHCTRIKGYVKFDLNVSASYHKDEQTLSEPLSTNYKAVYDRETHKIKVTFENHVTSNPYPSWWGQVERYVTTFIKDSLKAGKWKWRRKNNN